VLVNNRLTEEVEVMAALLDEAQREKDMQRMEIARFSQQFLVICMG
jgi:hypothetical protein